MYTRTQRSLQERFDTRRIADRLEEVKVHATITEADRAFIESRDMFFLATVDADGWPTCSYKGGDPGFVKILDERTLAFPCYDGNGMYLSMGNVASGGRVGMLFLDFEHPKRIRLEGTASLHFDDPLIASWPEAQFLARVSVERVYPNCPRYIHHYKLVERSQYVPHEGVETPTPDWKRQAWAVDALPAKGAGRTAKEP